ncbi:MAG TPA: helix-turn-helix domain-containing protein [Longimicrobium sp.]|jgi:transcriptional regulator with XRE-family HTH domain|nr:helix-turn-helix domain-containing protein [Longimicrobium sp.]
MLGEAVREARIRKGLTQARLARLAGVSRRHLAALEKGANVSINVLKKVAAVLELRDIQLGDLMVHSGNPDASPLNVPLLTDALREAHAATARMQAILNRAEGLLGSAPGDAKMGSLEVRFPPLPLRRLDLAAVSGDMVADGPEWTEVTTSGVLRQGQPIDEASTEQVMIPASLVEQGELVFRARGDGLRHQGIEDGDVLIAETRPRGRAATGEIVMGRIGRNVYVGRLWQKHGQKVLMSDGLNEVPVGRSSRTMKVVAVINQVIRPAVE